VLGVNLGDPLTDLKADMTVRDLGEFDQLLHTLDFEANGKKGTAAVPVVLHGAAVFHGTVMGRAADLDWKGHVQGTGLEVKLGTELDTLVDSVVADAEYLVRWRAAGRQLDHQARDGGVESRREHEAAQGAFAQRRRKLLCGTRARA
jgi:hypothetical protein